MVILLPSFKVINLLTVFCILDNSNFVLCSHILLPEIQFWVGASRDSWSSLQVHASQRVFFTMSPSKFPVQYSDAKKSSPIAVLKSSVTRRSDCRPFDSLMILRMPPSMSCGVLALLTQVSLSVVLGAPSYLTRLP